MKIWRRRVSDIHVSNKQPTKLTNLPTSRYPQEKVYLVGKQTEEETEKEKRKSIEQASCFRNDPIFSFYSNSIQSNPFDFTFLSLKTS